jgi:predicted nuclease of predicted toxin-antitoxin system
MVKRFSKHKVLLDENMPRRQYFPVLNEHFDVKHLAADLHQGGLADPQVYALARNDHRLLVTYNHKDFHHLATQSTETGVIGVSPHLTLAHIDTKLTSLLTKAPAKALYGKYTALHDPSV